MTQQLSQQRAYPAMSVFAHFAHEVAAHLAATERGWFYAAKKPAILQTQREDLQHINLDLTPFAAAPQSANAQHWFGHVQTLSQLLSAYQQARTTYAAEPNQQVHDYAEVFLQHRLDTAPEHYSDTDAQLIARWVSQLDLYAAVKSIECLLDSPDNLILFQLAETRGWRVLFDHLAIRCGSSKFHHAEQVVSQLQQQHGYVQSQLEHERFYHFDDGWNACPLYKMLNNGQVIRLFIDQSDTGDKRQIIQHWNHCYGFTAHHLALRVVRINDKHCEAIPLLEVIHAFNDAGVTTLTPTGFYTHGLLEQVFLQPNRNQKIPDDIRQQLSSIDPALNRTIENGKLLELVSRRELAPEHSHQLLNLYNIEARDSALSTPIYPYFLPAQAAHVIRTSLQTEVSKSIATKVTENKGN